MKDLQNKVAVVTGASKGIGAGIAKGLGAAGAAVVVNYASDEAGAAKVVADIVGAGGKAIAVQGNVSRAADVQRLFAETARAFGTLDVLVNNAGVFEFGPLEAVTEAQFHRQFDTNVLGPILTTQEAVKHFGPAGGGVINVSSVASYNPIAQSLVYSATKSAIDSLTRVLAAELAPRKIRVNSINPGYTVTEGAQAAGFVGSDGEKQMVARTALGRPGRPEDIAPLVVFLASDGAGWVTGETIEVSGGIASAVRP